MNSVLFGATTAAPSLGTNYNWFTATSLGTWNATQTNRDLIVSSAFTLSNLTVLTDTGPTSLQLTIMKNGGAATPSVTLVLATTGSDSTNTVSFASGDTISMRAVLGIGTAPGTIRWSALVTTSTDSFPVLGGASQNLVNSGVRWNGLQSTANWDSTENTGQFPMPCPGTFQNLNVKLNVAPGGSASYAFTLRVNAVDSLLATTIAAAATTGSDTTHTVTVALGDLVSFQSTPTSTPTATFCRWAMEFVPSASGESFAGYADNIGFSTTVSSYEQILGRGSNGSATTISGKDMVVNGMVLNRLYVKTTGAVGAGRSYTYTVMQNGSSTALAVTISGAAQTTGSTATNVTCVSGDSLAYQSTPTGGGALITPKLGLGIYFAPANVDGPNVGSLLQMMGVG